MSAEFPITNWGLGNCLQYTSEVMTEMRETSAKIADEPLTIGIFLSALSVFAASTGSALTSREGSYPLTVCPMPGDSEMATAMQLIGYEYLRHHAPDRLRRDLIGIPAADLSEVLGWLDGALKCKDWEWSPDQHALASAAYDRAMVFLNGFEHDSEAKDPKAGL